MGAVLGAFLDASHTALGLRHSLTTHPVFGLTGALVGQS